MQMATPPPHTQRQSSPSAEQWQSYHHTSWKWEAPQFPDPGQTSRFINGLTGADANSESSLLGVADVFFKDEDTKKLILQSNIDTSPSVGGVYVSFPWTWVGLWPWPKWCCVTSKALLEMLIKDFSGGAAVKNRLLMQGTQVRALIQEDPTCREAHYNHWTCALEPPSHNYWSLWA